MSVEKGMVINMKDLISITDLSIEEIQTLINSAEDIIADPDKY